jgi:hypothetical protein
MKNDCSFLGGRFLVLIWIGESFLQNFRKIALLLCFFTKFAPIKQNCSSPNCRQ